MSREIDEKIVSMRLDNSNFEKNAQESMSTLDKLKEKLQFKSSSDGLDKIADSAAKANPAFNTMGAAVDTVKMKLSALQVVGVTALSRITNAAIDAGAKLVKSLSIDQVSAGWSKYNDKTSSVQTIMSATGDSIEKVTEQLDKLMWYSDETSYSFTDMTSTVSKFVAAGVDLQTAASAVMGISNWAAVSGQNAQTASRAFYQLSQAMGTGAVKLQDWMSIENANMATQEFKQTAIDTAVELGTLVKIGGKFYDVSKGIDKKVEVTTQNFRETLRDGWFSSSVLTNVLSKYSEYSDAIYDISDAYDTASEAMKDFNASGRNAGMELSEKAFKNAQEAKTFAEAIGATQDAVSSQFLTMFDTLFGNYTQAKVLWTDVANGLWDTFAGPLEKINGVLKEAFDPKIDQFNKKLKDAGISAEDLTSALKSAGKEAGVDVDALIKKYGSLEEVIKSGELNVLPGAEGNANLLTLALKKLSDGATTAKKSTDIAQKSLEDYKKVVSEVVQGKYGNTEARYKALTKAGWDYKLVQDAVSVAWDGHTLRLDKLNKEMFKLSDAQLKSKGYTKEQIQSIRELAKEAETAGSDFNKLIDSLTKPSGRELLAKSITNVIDGINSWKEAAENAFSDVFGEGLADKIYKVVEAIEKFTSKLILSEDGIKKVQNVITSILRGGKNIKNTITAPLKTAGTLISTIASKISDVIKNSAKLPDFSKVSKWFSDLGKKISNIAKYSETARKKIQEWGKSLGKIKTFEEFKDGITDLVSQFPKLENGFEKIKGVFSKIKSTWNSFWNSNFIRNTRSTLSSAFNEISSNLGTFFNNAGSTISGWYNKIVEYIQNLISGKIKFSDIFKELRDQISKADVIKFFKDWGDKLKTLGTNAKETFKSIFDWIEKIAAKIKENFDDLGLGNLLGVITGIATLLGAKGVFKIGDAIGEVGGELGKGVAKATGILTDLRDTLKSYQKELKASALKEIAEALVMMAGAMWVIAQIPEDKFALAAGTLGTMLVALVGINTIIGLIGRKLPLGSTGFSAKLDSSGLSGSGSTSLMANMWLLTRAILSIVKAFKMLTDAGVQNMSWKKIGKVLSTMGLCMLELAGLATIIGRFSKLSIGTSFATLIQSIGIYAMMELFEKIANFDPNIVLDNIGSFITIFALIGTLMGETRLMADGSWGKSFSLIVLDVAVWLMGEVITKLSSIPWEQFKDGALKTLIIEGLLGLWQVLNTIIGVIGKIFKLTGNGASTKSFIGLAASIYAMAKAIDMLGSMSPEKLKQGTDAVAEIMLALSGILIAAKDFSGKAGSAVTGKAWQSILALSVFLSVFTIAMSILTALSDKQIEKMKTVANQMAKVFIAMAVAMAAAGLMGKWGVQKGPIITMMGMLAEIAIILGALTVFVKDGEKFKAIATGITEVLLAIAGAFAAIALGNKFGSLDHMGKIVALVAIMSAVAAGMGVLITWLSTWKNVNIAQMKAITESISILTVVIGGMSAILALVSNKMAQTISETSVAAQFKALGVIFTAMVGLIGVVIGAMSGIGSLYYYTDWFKQAMEGFAGFMESLADGLGRAKAAYDKAKGSTGFQLPSLEELGNKLSAFMENAQGFFDGLTAIEAYGDVGDKIKTFKKMLGAMTTAEIKSAIADWIETWGRNDGEQTPGALESMANGIYLFAKAIQNSKTALEGIDDTKLTLISSAFARFANIDVPKDAGKNLLDYAPDLVSFMDYLIQINEKAAQIQDTSKLSAISLIVKKLTDIGPGMEAYANAEKTYDLHNLGSNLLEFFGENLITLAGQLNDIAKAGESLDLSKDGGLDKFIQALNQIIEATKSIPETGGLLNFLGLVANSDPKTFADQMDDLVEAINSMNSAGENVDVRNFRNIKLAIETIQAITFPTSATGFGAVLKNINPLDVINDLGGTDKGSPEAIDKAQATVTDMIAFASFLEQLAGAMAKLNTSAADVSLENVNKLAVAIGTIGFVFNSKDMGFADLMTNENFDTTKVIDFIGSLTQLSTAMYDASYYGQSIDVESVKNVAGGLSALGSITPNQVSNLSNACGISTADGFSEFINKLGDIGYGINLLSNYGADTKSDRVLNVVTGLASIAYALDESQGIGWSKVTSLMLDNGYDTFLDKLDVIGTKVLSVSNSGSSVSVENINKVVAGLSDIAYLFGGGLIDWNKAFEVVGNDNFKSFLNGIADGGAFGIGKGIAEVVETISKKGSDINQENINKIVAGISSFASLFSTENGINWDNVKADTVKGLDGALASIMTSLDLLSGMGNIGIDDLTAVTEAIKAINELPKAIADLSKNTGKGVGENLLSGITESLSAEAITEKINSLSTVILSQIAALGPQLSVAGDQLGAGIETGLLNRVTSITSAASTVAMGAIKGVYSKYANAVTAGGRIALGVANGISRGKSTVSTAMSTLLTYVYNSNKQRAYNVGSNLGKQIITGMKDYINNNDGQVSSAISSMADKLYAAGSTGMTSMKTAGSKLGQNLVAGVVQGINQSGATLTGTFAATLNATVQAGNETTETHSPSRVTMYTGEMMVAGLVKGITDNAKLASSAGAAMARSALTGLSSTLSSVSTMASYTPTISPVVNLSGAKRGLSAIRSGVFNQAQTVNADVVTATKSRVSVEFENAEAIKNLSDKLDSIAENRTSEEYLKTIASNSKKQIYLNGRTLVGELTPDIDASLGRRVSRQSRYSY